MSPSRRDALLFAVLRGCGLLSGTIVVLIVLFLLLESWPALRQIGPARFLSDPAWYPAAGAERGEFNLSPMIAATSLATLGAMLLAAPLGIGSAVFVHFYAPRALGQRYRQLIQLLAGIPSVVYGLWGLVVLVPWVARWQPPGASLLSAIIILAIMIVPTIALVAGAALESLPREYLQAAAALGLSRWRTLTSVVLPATRSGLFTAVLLGSGRAIGETMAVLMVAGNVVQTPTSLFEPVRTLTANIALEMAYALGEHRGALFVSGLVLMVMVLALVALAEWVSAGSLLSTAAKQRAQGQGTAGQDRENPRALRCTKRAAWLRALLTLAAPVSQRWQRRKFLSHSSRRAAASPSGVAAVPHQPLAERELETCSGGPPRRASRFPEFTSTILAWSIAVAMTGVFVAILADIAIDGIPALSWQFLTAAPCDAGRAGGIGPILVSTLLILAVCMSVAVPLGVGTAVLLSELSPTSSRQGRLVRRSLDVLAGVPSIVFGLFGNAVFAVYLGLGFSILSGGLTLACMVLPILIRATEEGLRSVPQDYRFAAAALGLSRSTTLVQLLLPAAVPGVVVGLVLGIGRAIAETAALIFTSGYVDRTPESLLDSGRALSVHIFDLSMNVAGGDRHAYASALVLVVILVVINAAASWTASRWLYKGSVTT